MALDKNAMLADAVTVTAAYTGSWKKINTALPYEGIPLELSITEASTAAGSTVVNAWVEWSTDGTNLGGTLMTYDDTCGFGVAGISSREFTRSKRLLNNISNRRWARLRLGLAGGTTPTMKVTCGFRHADVP
jgi:hypothetical protein